MDGVFVHKEDNDVPNPAPNHEQQQMVQENVAQIMAGKAMLKEQ